MSLGSFIYEMGKIIPPHQACVKIRIVSIKCQAHSEYSINDAVWCYYFYYIINSLELGLGMITVMQWQSVTCQQQAGCVPTVKASELISHGDNIHSLLPQGKSGKA